MRDTNEHDESHDSPTHDRGPQAPGLRPPVRPGAELHDAEAHGPRHYGPEAPEPAFHDPAAHGASAEPRITLRGPAELADALPYLLGFHPTDSIVLVALHGESGRFGGRVRVGLPASPQEWPDIADQLAECLVTGSERRGPRPDGIVVFLCHDPSADGTGRQVMERLRPLAQRLRTACGSLDVPVREALCISDGRYWSYCCPDTRCCPAEGSVLALPGTSVMAAAATYAGIQVRGSLREMEERLTPWRSPAPVADQERALDAAAAAMFPRILGGGDRRSVADETLDLASRLMRRIAEAPVPPRGTDGVGRSGRGSGTLLLGGNAADELDDGLIAHDEAAAVILGLQDRTTRDWAAEWMEEPDAGPALRLWRALARRCVGPYEDHAAALLTLAGWVSWSTGDEPHARVAFGLALRADPEYRFAHLLHQACNQGLDPEELRVCLREERAARLAGPGDTGAATAPGAASVPVPGGTSVAEAASVPETASEPEAEVSAALVAEAAAEPVPGGAATQPGPRPAPRPKSRRDAPAPSGRGANRQRQKGSSARPGGSGRPEVSRPGPAGPGPDKARVRVRVRRRGGEPVTGEE
ncbi:DUF4192 family protein [Streptomyces xanthochromogenes]|uniref:DUF4192 domain-containing protein n=1 Tax=Streptomyces xanthochromogenes TaxID=67384 RepID=UPI00380A3554